MSLITPEGAGAQAMPLYYQYKNIHHDSNREWVNITHCLFSPMGKTVTPSERAIWRRAVQLFDSANDDVLAFLKNENRAVGINGI